MQFDSILMYAAISPTSNVGGPEDTGYLNRDTGEILFVCNTKAAREWQGEDAAGDSVRNRARIDANPDKWVEIPKNMRLPRFHKDWCEVRGRKEYWERVCTCGADEAPEVDADEFIREFLQENGIADPESVSPPDSV